MRDSLGLSWNGGLWKAQAGVSAVPRSLEPVRKGPCVVRTELIQSL